ncbi:adenylate/guanylate cyclase domain-containing protein [Candidatus Woesearchaeota archaeon]|nr:adenylate/guanylate cyclase domain-containing protein [Candidatus Woesearchaeota archaeon]
MPIYTTLKRIGNYIRHNHIGKISGLAAAGLLYYICKDGEFNLKDVLAFISGSISVPLGFACDFRNWYKDELKNVKDTLKRTEEDKLTDKLYLTKQLHLIREGKKHAIRDGFDIIDTQNLEKGVNEYLKSEPLAKKILDEMKREATQTGRPVSRMFFNPKTKKAVEFELQPKELGSYYLLARKKTDAEIKRHLEKFQGPLVAEYMLLEERYDEASRREAAILHADLRGFTKWTESIEPKYLMALLERISCVWDRILEENHMITRYWGDRVMAFTSPTLKKGIAYYAIDSAFRIREKHNEYKKGLKEKFNIDIPNLGIGLSYGRPAIGFLGRKKPIQELAVSEKHEHIEFTILGRDVNIPSRLCDIAAENVILATPDIMRKYYDEMARESMPPDYYQRFVQLKDPVGIKGYEEKIPVYFAKCNP